MSMTANSDSGAGDMNGLIRVGTVSSVDVAKGTARVSFSDRGMVSGNLKILKTQPLITVEKKKTPGGSYTTTATYASADRSLGKGESYDKATPDNIDVIGTCTYAGDTKDEETKFEVYPWMPYIGQMVVCLYSVASNCDGFILGGL